MTRKVIKYAVQFGKDVMPFLARGYELYGSPILTNGGVAQTLIQYEETRSGEAWLNKAETDAKAAKDEPTPYQQLLEDIIEFKDSLAHETLMFSLAEENQVKLIKQIYEDLQQIITKHKEAQ